MTAFLIYNLHHMFCTRLSEVAADAVVRRAMPHPSLETKRRYQWRMADQWEWPSKKQTSGYTESAHR